LADRVLELAGLYQFLRFIQEIERFLQENPLLERDEGADDDGVAPPPNGSLTPEYTSSSTTSSTSSEKEEDGNRPEMPEPEGEWREAGAGVLRVEGSARALLTAERTALNFLGRLSGVATATAKVVRAMRAAGATATLLDTRKTTPGLRYLEKYAVKLGGGENHRFALWDMYLVKDNHIRAAGGVTAAIERIQRTRQDVPLEVEVESLVQLREALRPEVDRILVDNRPVEEVRRAVEEVDLWFAQHPPESRRMRKGARRWPEVEVSGGLTLDNVRRYAETGVDYLSVGALTHSAPAVNLSLEIEDVG